MPYQKEDGAISLEIDDNLNVMSVWPFQSVRNSKRQREHIKSKLPRWEYWNISWCCVSVDICTLTMHPQIDTRERDLLVRRHVSSKGEYSADSSSKIL